LKEHRIRRGKKSSAQTGASRFWSSAKSEDPRSRPRG
jgi:hypothetical protein